MYSRSRFSWQVSDKRRPIYHSQYIILGRRQMYTRQIIIIKLRTTSLTNWKVAVVMRKTHRRNSFVQELFRSIYLCSLQIQMPNVIPEHISMHISPDSGKKLAGVTIRNMPNIIKRWTLLKNWLRATGTFSTSLHFSFAQSWQFHS